MRASSAWLHHPELVITTKNFWTAAFAFGTSTLTWSATPGNVSRFRLSPSFTARATWRCFLARGSARIRRLHRYSDSSHNKKYEHLRRAARGTGEARIHDGEIAGAARRHARCAYRRAC